MFATIPCKSATNTTETRIINFSNVEQIRPAGVSVIEEEEIESSELLFTSGVIIIALITVETLRQRLLAVAGTVDDFGQPL